MARIYIVLLFCFSSDKEIFGQCPATSTVSVGYTSVTVSPPGYPAPGYDPNLSCSWLGSSSISGASILYRVTDITTDCPDDAINVYNGVDNTGTHVHINECNTAGTGSRTLGYKVSSTGNVYTTFTSDASQSSSELGFKMYMISGKDFSGTGCTGTQTLTATTTEQYLSSPSFPNIYPTNQTCIWEISATDSSANIIIDIKFLNIEFDGSCIYDYLEISESGTSRAKLCNEDKDTDWDPTKTYTSTGNSFTVKMRSDNAEVRIGFLLSYIQTGTVTTEAATTQATTDNKSTTEQQTIESSTTNTIASSSNTSLTDPKDSDAGIIAGVTVGVMVVVVGVTIGGVVFILAKKSRSKKRSIGAGNQNKKQAFIEEEEVGLPSSSDIQGNANNAPSSSLMVKNNTVSPTYVEVNDNKVSPTYNDYVVYALPTCYRVMPHRPVFVGEWEHKYSL